MQIKILTFNRETDKLYKQLLADWYRSSAPKRHLEDSSEQRKWFLFADDHHAMVVGYITFHLSLNIVTAFIML